MVCEPREHLSVGSLDVLSQPLVVAYETQTRSYFVDF